jgi:predicted DCC family thiol-disulfide oxidoreductase YuxK
MLPILLYDGVCSLCNRLVQFILKRDPQDSFRFASLQSAFAARILNRHGGNPRDLDTVYVVLNYELPDEHLLARSDAVLFALKQLGGGWRFLGLTLRIFPRIIRDRAYHLVARYRYQIFGRSETCILPNPETRSRFLDM